MRGKTIKDVREIAITAALVSKNPDLFKLKS
jgi:hypothetical protein